MSNAFELNNPDYGNQKAVPDFATYFERWRANSEAFRAAANGLIDVPYGNGWRQTLDIFPVAVGRKVPVFVFIHGGWWYFLDKKDHSFIAKPYYERDCVCVCLTYPLAPMVTIGEIVESVRQALVWVYRNIDRFGGDRDQIHIAGHSAGGHLTGMMMLTDWVRHGGTANMIKSGCAVSGLFDLTEIVNVPQNANIRLLPGVACENSPVRLLPDRAPPFIICVGKNETAGFLRQHDVIVKAWPSATRPVVDASLAGENHFSVIERLAQDDSPLFKTVFEYVSGGSQ